MWIGGEREEESGPEFFCDVRCTLGEASFFFSLPWRNKQQRD